MKGLARKELLFAIDHLNGIARPELLRMISWQIGLEQGFSFSFGKNYKYIKQYLPKEDWETLISTYSQDGYVSMWQALFTSYAFFRKYATTVAKGLGFEYPDYDKAITKYTQEVYQ